MGRAHAKDESLVRPPARPNRLSPRAQPTGTKSALSRPLGGRSRKSHAVENLMTGPLLALLLLGGGLGSMLTPLARFLARRGGLRVRPYGRSKVHGEAAHHGGVR